jgi:predicted PurR-regulated permease PerM
MDAPLRERPLRVDRQSLTAGSLYRAVLLAFGLYIVTQMFPLLAGLLLLALLIVIVAVPLSAATTRLERVRVPRALGAPLILLTAIAAIGGLIALLVPAFVNEGRALMTSLPDTVDHLRHSLSRTAHSRPGNTGTSFQSFVNGYVNHPQKLIGPATTVGAGVAGVLTMLVVTLITALYIAIRPQPLQDGALRLVSPARRAHAKDVMFQLAQAYVGWLRGLAAGMAVLWVVTYIGLMLVGLPYPVVWATLTAIAMVVPYYGALVSAVPPILLALTISPGTALLVALVYLVAHQVEGNLIEPLVMARAVELHPALVAIGVIAVERLFGFAGLLVAVPILVTVKILITEFWVRPLESADLQGEPDEPRFGPTRTNTRLHLP